MSLEGREFREDPPNTPHKEKWVFVPAKLPVRGAAPGPNLCFLLLQPPPPARGAAGGEVRVAGKKYSSQDRMPPLRVLGV